MENVLLSVRHLKKAFGNHMIFEDFDLDVRKGEVVVVIGPSGCGKSTLLRCLNGLEPIQGGEILLDGEPVLRESKSITRMRQKIGMVFQKPNPFPMSIYDNIAYGPRTHGVRKKDELDEIVEQSLRGAAIWDEVKDRLKDEPTSALDPISTSKIEELATNLKEQYTIIIVTHNMQQALRISDKTAFFLLGELIEYDDTQKLFYQPKEKRTEDYITGRFG